jgi:chromosome segregation ATPase
MDKAERRKQRKQKEAEAAAADKRARQEAKRRRQKEAAAADAKRQPRPPPVAEATPRATALGTLGLGPAEGTPDKIRAAYRRLALKWHPDKNTSAGAVEQFRRVQEAYEYLTN